jgi:hypothetical protein
LYFLIYLYFVVLSILILLRLLGLPAQGDGCRAAGPHPGRQVRVPERPPTRP